MITLITPNFNKAEYISETIASVLNQTIEDWELVIVDDGSTDTSVDLITNYLDKDSRIRLLRRSRNPKGGSTCRNIGLESSAGNYVVFLDSDDLLSPTALENRLEQMEKSPGLDFAVFPMETFYKKIGDSVSVWRPPDSNHLHRFLKHDLPWSTIQPIWKRDFLIQIGGFDEEYPRLQDVELHSRALFQNDVNYKIVRDVSPDCFYRIDERRLVSSQKELARQFVDGGLMYVRKMIGEIESAGLNLSKRKRCLRGTILSLLTQLLYRQRQKIDGDNDFNFIFEQILSDSDVRSLISPFTMKCFISLTHLGAYRVKGFNYLFKWFCT